MGNRRKPISTSLSCGWLTAEVIFLLGLVRIGLVTLPFNFLRQILACYARRPMLFGHPTDDSSFPDRLTWTVETVGPPFWRNNSCLAKALVAQTLLDRHGWPTSLHIGVLKDRDGRLRAHAWLETEGVVLIGGPSSALAGFVPILVLKKESTGRAAALDER